MTSEPFTLRWGILATGGIAKTFTKDLLVDPLTRDVHDIRHVVAAAASSTSASRASEFLHEVGAPSTAAAYGSYAALVRDRDVDIIYIATPHSHHYQHTRLALEAGKHVLVEKPITVNAAQARALYALAREKNRFLMEAVWTRFFPLTRAVQSFIAAGRLGTVKRVVADLSFWNDVEAEFGSEHRMVNMHLAGGALLDLGIYSLTWVFLVLYHLQAASREGGQTAPAVHAALSKYPATGCDEMTSVVLDFAGAHVGTTDTRTPTQSLAETQKHSGNGDAHALALTNIRVSHAPNATHPSPDPVRIQGTLGEISVAAPSYRPESYTLIPAQNAARGKPGDFEVETRVFEIPVGHGMFWEADECARCVRDGKLESETMGWEESVAVMGVMDEVRRQGGLVYPEPIESLEYPLEGFGL
ncbi:putative oxidoreductase [Didymella exigua CBS 183.55]|uniref:D-xylose 1-dehydrogenase (NADP(+), D-xylono-1,5-lactone-forming) n=1 Tax=Didymella exigua CBS 183.55 TaxID=1150837 RepID=A0A6A5RI76_9PLEO|nr:putative oxidoreductase [Didymella exigua CBS 183.55]KAF1926794.1 putative oxidoreductase [Didymella exigua CBS 183.55]